MCFKPALAPGNPKIGRKWGPRAPKISSGCLRKSLDFEIGVGDRLGTLRAKPVPAEPRVPRHGAVCLPKTRLS